MNQYYINNQVTKSESSISVILSSGVRIRGIVDKIEEGCIVLKKYKIAPANDFLDDACIVNINDVAVLIRHAN